MGSRKSKPYDKMLVKGEGFVEDFVNTRGNDTFSVWSMYFTVWDDTWQASVNYMFSESLSKARTLAMNAALVNLNGNSINESVLGDGFGGAQSGTPVRKIPAAPLNWLSRQNAAKLATANVGFAKINEKDKTFLIRFWMHGVTEGFMLTFRGMPDQSYLGESRSGYLSEMSQAAPTFIANGF